MSTSSGAPLHAAPAAEMPFFRHQHPLMLAVCIAVLALSCKKDEDTTPPTVMILAPANGSTLSVPGTITVSAEVSDDIAVESATISLTDDAGVPIAASITVSIGSASATFQRSLAVTSELITSGSYTLTVRASDGRNDGRDFRTLQVLEAPLRLRALFAVCTPTAATVEVHRVDSVGNVSLFGTFLQDLNDAAISSRDRRLFLAGGVNGPLVAVDLDAGLTPWQIANNNTLPIPWFTGGDLCADGRLYVSTNDGIMRVFNAASGGQQFSTTAVSGYRAYLSHVQDDLILSEQVAISGPDRKLAVYSAFSGTEMDQQLLDKDLIAMYRRSNDRALLFGNRNGDGVIEDRFISAAFSTDLTTFIGEEIKAVASASSDLHFIALPGRIVRYTASSNSSVDLSTLGATDLAYDPTSNTLWAAHGSTIDGLDAMNGTVTGTHTVPTAIDHLFACFNR